MKRIVKCCLALALGFAVAGCSKDGGHKKVQLWKNGPYWAETNIGADMPWERGYYFWWGDTVGYKRVDDTWVASDGSSSNFWFDPEKGPTPTYGKDIATLQSEGWIISQGGTSVLSPAHDAAYVKWGGDWRMPTKQELDDLSRNCDWVWTTKNGVNGYEVRGRGDYASNSIFLPLNGDGLNTFLRKADKYASYWSSVPDPIYSGGAGYLYFGSSGHGTNDSGGRWLGHSVRPVQGPTK